jgi:hypothetical protein
LIRGRRLVIRVAWGRRREYGFYLWEARRAGQGKRTPGGIGLLHRVRLGYEQGKETTLTRGPGVAVTQDAGPRRQRHKEKGKRARRPAASAGWAGPLHGPRPREKKQLAGFGPIKNSRRGLGQEERREAFGPKTEKS